MYGQQSDWNKREFQDRMYLEVSNAKFLMFSMLRRPELSDGKMEDWDNLGTTVLVLLKSTNSKQNKEEMDGRFVQSIHTQYS